MGVGMQVLCRDLLCQIFPTEGIFVTLLPSTIAPPVVILVCDKLKAKILGLVPVARVCHCVILPSARRLHRLVIAFGEWFDLIGLAPLGTAVALPLINRETASESHVAAKKRK